jgi:hypothetical protein
VKHVAQLDHVAMTMVALEEGTALGAKKPRRFTMDPAYSGAVFEHPIMGPCVIDLAGLVVEKDGAPAFRQHSPDRFVGRIDEWENDGAKLVLLGFLFDGVAEASEVASISDQGGKWQASVRCHLDLDAFDFIGAGSSVSVNKRTLPGPLTVARKSTLRESSFVPIGADQNTAAIALSSHQKESRMPAPETTPAVDPVKALKDQQAAIRKAFEKDPAFALEAITEGWSLVEAKAQRADRLEAKGAEDAKKHEAALAEATKRAELAEAKSKKPNPAAELGGRPASKATPPPESGDAIERWDAALAAEIQTVTADEIEAMALRRGLPVSTDANRRAVAVAKLCERDPELHGAYVQEFNRRGIGNRNKR